MTYSEAQSLPIDERVTGLKVSGDKPPFGGSWQYDSETNELTLILAPTKMEG